MKRAFVLFLLLSGFLLIERSHACTNILVTKGASADGSTFITYAADAGVKIIFEISFNFDIPGYPVSVYKISMLEKKYMLKNSRVVSYEKKDVGVFTQKSDVILALNAMIKKYN